MTHEDDLDSSSSPHGESPARVRTAATAVRTRALAWWSRRPVMSTIVVVLVAALVVLGADAALLALRLERLDVTMPSVVATEAPTLDLADLVGADATGSTPPAVPVAPAPAESWLIVGTDTRENLPEQDPDQPNRFGDVELAGAGERADVVAVVSPSAEGMDVLVLPRDLTLGPIISPVRLATSYLEGPQRTIDLLCAELGIATTHLVVLDMAGFDRIIDSLGGVEVDFDTPVRDGISGLEIPAAGTHLLDGADALALVRSRHPEIEINGTWTPLSASEGAAQRTTYTAVVMRAVLAAMAARTRTPLGAQSLAWSLSGNLAVDSGTGLADLVSLARTAADAGDGSIEVVTVPAPQAGDTFIALPSAETYTTLAAHGHAPGRCAPSS